MNRPFFKLVSRLERRQHNKLTLHSKVKLKRWLRAATRVVAANIDEAAVNRACLSLLVYGRAELPIIGQPLDVQKKN